MKALLLRAKAYAKSRCMKLADCFEGTRQTNQGFLGLGQFVLLLAIAPFIFDLKLYSFSELEEVPSLYEYSADRFEALPTLPNQELPPKAPSKPRSLSKKEKQWLATCGGVSRIFYPKYCPYLEAKRAKYNAQKKNYNKRLKQYRANQKAYQQRLKSLQKVKAAYSNFRPELLVKEKPEVSPEVKQWSSRSFTALLDSRVAVSAWQDTGAFIWLLGALLMGPAIWLCIRERCWSLLIFGLSVPAFNYLLFLVSLFPSAPNVSGLTIHSSVAAQVAFAWFALKGHMLTKSFAWFILLLSLSVSWAAFLGGEYSSIFKAQLPILVFILTAALARLVVKGVQENAYLFAGHGWLSNLRKALHALVLWVPLALLALPAMYFMEIAAPKHMVNTLHKNGVLIFDYDHDVLDNALQSVATKTDDAMYAWHLSTESAKRDIYLQANSLINESLRKRFDLTFDQVMPGQLQFEEYESDKFLIGEGIELAVGAAQGSTNKAFKRMRNQMKRQLGGIVSSKEKQFKIALDKGANQALAAIDEIHLQGQEALLVLNQQTQSSVWWTINYVRAAHMLALLIFVFVCLKSFLYVFARVSFNRDTGTFVTLGNTDKAEGNVKSLIKPTGLHYLIEADTEEVFYISRRFECRGRAPRFTIPQPLRALLSRFFNGAVSMNKVVMHQGDDAVRCTATQGIEFFEWELADGEEVLFDFHNFVGMSEGIRISTLISTRASSLLLGRMIHSQATGPGKLILMAEGRAEITCSEMNEGSVPPERIIATHKDTCFHIDSELDPVNVYLSSAYVRPAGGGQVIVDVDSQRGNKTGLGSFVKRFILPV